MKAILVIDMPETCEECPCYKEKDLGEWDSGYLVREHMYSKYCDASHYGTPSMTDRPSWCPLKPMPKKVEVDDCAYANYWAMRKGYQCGYNACIDEILGGETE